MHKNKYTVSQRPEICKAEVKEFWRPRLTLLLAKAEVAEGGADVDRDGALERAVGRVGGDGVGLAERGVGVLGRRDGRVHVVHGAAVEGEGSDVGDHGGVDGGGLGRGVAVGAHGHCKF